MKLVFIDDDPECRRRWRQWAKLHKEHSVRTVESCFDASTLRADVFIIDITSAGGFGVTLAGLYSPIAKLMDLHPSAQVILTSAVSRNAVQELIQEVAEVVGRAPLYAGIGYVGEIERALTKLEGLI